MTYNCNICHNEILMTHKNCNGCGDPRLLNIGKDYPNSIETNKSFMKRRRKYRLMIIKNMIKALLTGK